MEKECFRCKTKKPIDEFYKHSGMKDGHLNKCKTCTRNDVSENYRKNIDHYKQYEKDRFSTDKRKLFREKAQKQRRANNPIKYKAVTAVGNAIRDGRLVKLPCQVCRTTEKVEAHHDDYSKPLDVKWLCFKHHREFHGQIVE